MKVDYLNHEIHDDFARVTFMGHDVKGRRRPMIDLDTSDLRNLVRIAKEFRERQRALQRRHQCRVDDISTELS